MNLSDIPAFVINLPERKDRLESFMAQSKYLGLDVKVVPGIRDHRPMIGIALAHLSVIRSARDNNLPYCLIMEDDVCFHAKEKTAGHLNEALNNMPEDWEILLGSIYEGQPRPFNDYWNHAPEFCGLHFYILNSKVYDQILNNYDQLHHIDRWMNKGGKKMKAYVLKKFISSESCGFSDNVNKVVDYSDKLKRYELLC